jgi:hypothetical protein
LSYLSQDDERALLAAGFPACFIDELLGIEAGDSRVENRLTFVRNFRFEPKSAKSSAYEINDLSVAIEASTPLPGFPPGPWRSLGGCFDYSEWADRDRFLELDKALASAHCGEPEHELQSEVSMWIDEELLRA